MSDRVTNWELAWYREC